ncbi:polysaccharide deacetylase family protein [Ornithinimicrobium sp. W1665]|uniref:polysaccharide deacetylase family protein n=1 Tax=Ornithinimicrobium sp. W1665 TaxID=3416666 RepID=UPI003CEC33E7
MTGPSRRRRVLPALLPVLLAATLVACGGDGGTPADVAPTTSPTAPPTAAPSATPDGASPTPSPSPGRPTATTAPEPPSSPAPPGPTPTSTPTPYPSPSPTTAPPAPTTPPAPPPTTPAPDPAVTVGAWAGLDVEAFDTDRAVVALTFDGGASDAALSSILGTLAQEGVPATFFVTGDFARAYPGGVTAIARAGHPVGNHSDTHVSFPDSTNAQIHDQLVRADAAISALTGRATAPLFRFPFGDRTPLDVEVVNAEGYVPIRWTVDTLGWQGTSGGITTAVVRERVRDTARRGQVVLMHVGAHPEDGSTLDADALPGMIEDLRAMGYGFTTVPQLLAEGR